MFKKIAVIAITLLVIAIIPAGCGQKTGQPNTTTPEKVKITDLAGREVEVPVPVKKIVAVGPGALRLVCYVNAAGKVAGVEEIEKKQAAGRPYILAHPELKDLPVIGQGGPDTATDAEKLVSVKPDVIFATYFVDRAAADELQSKTNIPVVVLSYGKQLATFDEDIYKSLSLIGKITAGEKRATEVVDYLKTCLEELNARTKEIPADKKPKVYVGALGMKGTHGLESTQAKYPPFANINAVNVVDETGKAGSLMIDKEKILTWDPDFIFIDENGYSLVLDDYRKNQQFYQSLSAFKRGEVYGQIPYNFYTTNIDTAIADAYYAGKVIFPEQFKDVDPVKKADEIYQFLLGKPVYEQMARDYGGFKKLNFDAP